MKVLVVGDGPVARALCAALAGKVTLARWYRKLGSPPPATEKDEVVVVAVSDRGLAEVAARIGASSDGAVLLHMSGAHSAEEIFADAAPARGGLGVMHPMRAVPDGTAERLRGAYFAVEGDRAGQAAAIAIVALLDGKSFTLTREQMVRYHAACVLASSHVLALVDTSAELLRSFGVEAALSEEAALDLARSALEGARARGITNGVTGPIARGDSDVVARHLAALDGSALASLYRATAARVFAIVERKGLLSAESLAGLRRLVGHGDDG